MNILDALGDWSAHRGPLYRRLATAIQRAIADGDIPPGTALPAERNLARSLALGRSTVVGAYDLLRAEGLLESKQGSGTWVAGAARATARGAVPQESLRGAALSAAEHPGAPIIDLATASLPAAQAVREALDALGGGSPSGDALDELLSSSGYSALGLLELRRAVAEVFTDDGVPTTPDQVLITTGDQQALSLICSQYLSLGDTAVVEDPTSPGMLDLLHEAPVAIRSSPSISRAGVRPLLEIVGRAHPALVYLFPALGPEGLASDEAELRTLAAALRGYSGAIVEDGVIVEDTGSRYLLPAGERPSLLAGLAPEAGILTVGSMSKVFWGGLRIGWVRGDENAILRLSRAKARADLGTPMLSQEVAARLLRRLNEVGEARERELSARREVALAVLQRSMPEFTCVRVDGGGTLWLKMPRGASRPFCEVAKRHGVAVVPGAALSAGGSSDAYLRVALGADAAAFAEGAERLAQAWSQYDQRAAIGGSHDPMHEGATLV